LELTLQLKTQQLEEPASRFKLERCHGTRGHSHGHSTLLAMMAHP
jgi:hypothetical protein